MILYPAAAAHAGGKKQSSTVALVVIVLVMLFPVVSPGIRCLSLFVNKMSLIEHGGVSGGGQMERSVRSHALDKG
jgi:hypothetical protein